MQNADADASDQIIREVCEEEEEEVICLLKE